MFPRTKWGLYWSTGARINILNLYAGIGGNRAGFPADANVLAIEQDENVAAVYRSLYPDDDLVVGDAHSFLLENYGDFDWIWSSPPCVSHTQMDRMNSRNKLRYPDLSLYQEIILLDNYFGPMGGKWLVENVKPYYQTPLIPALKLGRHLFWSNFHIGKFDVPRPPNWINAGTVNESQGLKDWLGLDYPGNVYPAGGHCPAQPLRSCVHPRLAEHIYKCSIKMDLFE
jgi:DNA (cytosine-5)-methyltransferase 1